MFIDIFFIQNQGKYPPFLAIFLISGKRFYLVVNRGRSKAKEISL